MAIGNRFWARLAVRIISNTVCGDWAKYKDLNFASYPMLLKCRMLSDAFWNCTKGDGKAAEIRRRLTGRWRRVPGPGGSVPYPDEITFAPNGLYRGVRGANGAEFTIWDVGRSEVLAADRIRISTANDEEIEYRFELAGDELRFPAAEGSPVAFRRMTS